MDSKDKKEHSETDIKAKFITPSLLKAGWDEMPQLRREVTLTLGPVVVRGNLSSRNKKKKKFADYVLLGLPLEHWTSPMVTVKWLGITVRWYV